MKSKSLLLSCLATVFLASCHKEDCTVCSGTPFSKVYGSSEPDGAYSILSSADGGYVFAGWESGNDGNVTGNHGREDVWVVKLNCNGGIQWQKALGGSSTDVATAIIAAPDGGYIVAGQTNSNDGDVTNNHGGADSWIVKLNGSGSIVWQKTFGDIRDDGANSIVAAPGGGYVFLSYSDADVTGHHSNFDLWVTKIDNDGNQVWKKVYGGDSFDGGQKIITSVDGGYLFVGSSSGAGGQAWAVKLDADGNESWNKKLGGSKEDAFYDVTKSPDGGYVLGGYTYSTDGDVINNQGGSDAWIVKLNGSGSIVWQKTFGGSNDEKASGIVASPDGEGYLFAGATASNDGDVGGNHGGDDGWLVKLDGNGNKILQKTFGGSNTIGETFFSIIATSEQGYAISGGTYSNDGDVSGNHGSEDAWILTIKDL